MKTLVPRFTFDRRTNQWSPNIEQQGGEYVDPAIKALVADTDAFVRQKDAAAERYIAECQRVDAYQREHRPNHVSPANVVLPPDEVLILARGMDRNANIAPAMPVDFGIPSTKIEPDKPSPQYQVEHDFIRYRVAIEES